jgi:hypothetical protein
MARVADYPIGSKRAERAQLLNKAERLLQQGRTHAAEVAYTEAEALLVACVNEAEKGGKR